MERLLSAKQLPAFSHLCLRTGLKYSSSSSTGYKNQGSDSSGPLVSGRVLISDQAVGSSTRSLNHWTLHKVYISKDFKIQLDYSQDLTVTPTK